MWGDIDDSGFFPNNICEWCGLTLFTDAKKVNGILVCPECGRDYLKTSGLTGVIDKDMPSWKNASTVYDIANTHMEKYGSDNNLIKALYSGKEKQVREIVCKLIKEEVKKLLSNHKIVKG